MRGPGTWSGLRGWAEPRDSPPPSLLPPSPVRFSPAPGETLPGAGCAVTEVWLLLLHKAQQSRSRDSSVFITCTQVDSWGNGWASQRTLRLETSEGRPRRWWHLIRTLSWSPGEEGTPQQGDAVGERSGASARGKCRAVTLCPGSPGRFAEKLFLLNLSRTFLEPSTPSSPSYHPAGSASAAGSVTKSINKPRSAEGSSQSHHRVTLTPERTSSWVGLGCLGTNELGGTFCPRAVVTPEPWQAPT